jgi:hypothetical protein
MPKLFFGSGEQLSAEPVVSMSSQGVLDEYP